MTAAPLGWPSIFRLGLVQAAIGAMVMVGTSLFNRVMVVEYALPAALPAGLVAWHYAVQLSRPLWGHGSDHGGRRTLWIVAGMALLACGTMLAAESIGLFAARSPWGLVVAVGAYAMIGGGVGAAGTSLLALLASQVAPERRAAAAAITWLMMIAGIAVSAGIVGALVDPFSLSRLSMIVGGVSAVCLALTLLALWGLEGARRPSAIDASSARRPPIGQAISAVLADAEALRFTIFVFLSMLAYSMQDLVLEPFAGLLFAFTPGQSTQLSGIQHGGVLAGMLLVGALGGGFGRRRRWPLRRWIFIGCIGSATAQAGLAVAAHAGPGWPLTVNVAVLGVANGMFAVAAIGLMMELAGAHGGGSEGVRMGVWGAAQATAFGLGGLFGAIIVDIGRTHFASDANAFVVVFGLEACLFLAAAMLALSAAPRTVGMWPQGASA